MRFDEFRASKNEIDPELDQLTEAIIGACIEVHRELGPGLTERLYEEALCHELELRHLSFSKQVAVPVRYKGRPIGDNRIDLIVEDKVIVGGAQSVRGIEQRAPRAAHLLSAHQRPEGRPADQLQCRHSR